MSAIAIVDVQGFKIAENKFILKEIAIACKDQLQVLLIKPPFPIHNLTPEERRHVNWIQRNRKIYWNEGFVPYSNSLSYIEEFLSDKTIYCKGLEKMLWIKEMLDYNNVYNLETKSCPSLLSLYEEYRLSTDVYNCIYHPTICSLKNVTCLKKWCLNNKLF